MAKAFVLIRTADNTPDIPQVILDDGPINYVLCDIKGAAPPVGAYLMAAKGAQLVAIDDLPYALGIMAVTEDDEAYWSEGDDEAAQETIDKINAWLTNQGIEQQIPSGWTYSRLVRELFLFFNERFDLKNFYIMDV